MALSAIGALQLAEWHGRVIAGGATAAARDDGFVIANVCMGIAIALATTTAALLIGRARRRAVDVVAVAASAATAQRRLARVLELSQDAVFVYSPDGEPAWVSAAYERMFGRRGPTSRDEARSQVHPDDLAESSALARRAMTEPGFVGTSDVRVIHADGHWVPTQFTVCDMSADSDIGGMVITYTDLTRREADAAALSTSAALHAFLTENATEVLLRVMADTTVAYVSAAVSLLLEYAPGDLVGMPLAGIVHPDGRPMLAASLVRASDEGGAVRFDVRLLPNAGDREVWVEASVQCVIGVGDELEFHVSLRDIGARREAERALADAEAMQRLILGLLEEGVVLHDRDAGLVSVNAAAQSMLGITSGDGPTMDQVAGRMTVHEPDGAVVPAADAPSVRAMRTGRPDRRRLLELRDAHRSRWVEVDTVPTGVAADGSPKMALSTFRDVTEARRAAAELAASEERFRVLAENTKDLISLTDNTGGFAYLSPSATSVLGLTVEEAMQHTIADLVGPGDIERLRVAATTGAVVRHHVLHADGDLRWAESIAHRLFEADGSPRGIMCSTRDVSDRVIVEEALSAERHLLATTLSSVHAGVLAVSADGIVIEANDWLLTLIGAHVAKGEQLVALRSLFTLLDQDGREWPSDRMPLTIALGGDTIANVSAKVARRDGTVLDVIVNASPLDGFDGRPNGAVLTVHDVSDLRAAEAELRRLAAVDALTGLPNRRRLAEHLGQAIERNRRHPERLAVCFLDLDGFKPVNDRLGHESGDELLRLASERISAIVRTADLVARYGGDEFAIVVEDLAHPNDAVALAQRLEHDLSEPFDLVSGCVHIGGSVGVAGAVDGSTAASLLARADAAMYDRKATRKAAHTDRPAPTSELPTATVST